MISSLATLAFVIAAWLSFAAATSLAVTLAWRGSAGWLRSVHPKRRAAAALAAALAPAVVPTLLVVVCLTPGLTSLLGSHGDHCLGHGYHPHLCLVHFTGALHAPVLAVLALGAGALGVALVQGSAKLARTRRFIAALRSLARRGPDPDVGIVPSEKPFSFAAGLSRGEVWVSSALVDALGPDELNVVLIHERAHLERGDPRRRAAAETLSFPLWPSVRRAILAELALASEQACDEVAGQRLGTRLRVAETILAVERLAGAAMRSASSAGLPAFGGSNVAERVRNLLDEVPPAPSRRVASWAAVVFIGGGLWLVADPLHHMTEHWLRLLLHLG